MTLAPVHDLEVWTSSSETSKCLLFYIFFVRFNEIIKMDVSSLEPSLCSVALTQTRLLSSGFAMVFPYSSPVRLVAMDTCVHSYAMNTSLCLFISCKSLSSGSVGTTMSIYAEATASLVISHSPEGMIWYRRFPREPVSPCL